MKYAKYYKRFQADCELMGTDEIVFDLENPGSEWTDVTDEQLIDMAVNGAGLRGVGDELARRNLLDQVPGNNWGE